MGSSRFPETVAPAGRRREYMLIALACVLTVALVLGILLPTIESLRPHFRLWGMSAPLPPLFLLLIGGLPAPFVHEMGHLVAGLLARFRFVALGLGPLRLSRNGRLRLHLQMNAAFWGGYAVVAPAPGDTSSLRRRIALYTLGGPVGSILIALVALGLSGALPLAAWAAGPVILLRGFAALSASLGLITLLPLPVAPGAAGDGLALLRLFRSPEYSESTEALFALRSAATFGEPPAEWSPDQVEIAARSSDEGALYAYCHALDRGDVEEAAEYLGRALTLSNGRPSAGLALELAYFEAAHEDDAESAARRLHRVTSGGFLAAARPRALAALHLAEGRTQEVRAKLDEAHALVASHAVPGLAGFERALLHTLASRLAQSTATASPS